jgi:nicotinamidase/pyrazinamidase
MREALLIVDVQNDFLPGGALPVPHGDEVIAVANRLSLRFDLVIATQDWHPADHGSFAANHPGHRVGDVIQLNGLPQMLWAVHCVQESAGAQFAAGLDIGRISRVFRKGTDPAIDSYSGLFDNGHRHSTGLGEFLHAEGVKSVYVMGLATDYCVKFTALDAIAVGFDVRLMQDGCRGVELSPGDVDRALEEMRRSGVKMVASGDVHASK